MKVSIASGIFGASALVAGLNTTNSTSASTGDTAYLASGYLDLGIASDAYEKAKAFVSGLNNTEKIAIAMATSFTGTNKSWTAYSNTDGVDGLNFYYFVSAFPMTNALTMTWNRALISAQFKAVGDEYFATGNNMVDGALLGPLGRVPQGGRQNEAFSPDPYLSGVSVAEGIIGQNSAGVVAGVRHFLLYEQESNRTGGSGDDGGENVYSANADDKTLHEVYMWPWGDAIYSGAQAVMCAMPLVNGTHSCSNNELLTGKLKNQLGFAGLVYPDESAQFTSYSAATAGLDYSPYSNGLWTQDILGAGVSNGSIPQERLDDMAVRSVLPYYFVGLDKNPAAEKTAITAYRNIRGNHSALIREIGGEAIALLKNNNTGGGGLPLVKPHSLALFGAHAGPAMAGPNYAWSVSGTGADVFQGHLAQGGGSGGTSLPYLITPFNSLTQRAVDNDAMIWWIMNNTLSNVNEGASFGGGIGGGTGSTASFEVYAAAVEVCLVFINSWSGEGTDRSELYNTEQDELVTSVADNCNNTIVVVNISGPRILEAWILHENVTAVIYSGLLGQESGNAIANVLYGDVNPSGKLIHTIAKQTSDYPAAVCTTLECSFDEGVYIDYRWFDKQAIEPRFPFGHGLSYTTFAYNAVSATVINSTALASKYPTGKLSLGGLADLYDEVITVTATVENTGSLAGAEVAQLYVSFPAEAEQPARILRGFEKVNVSVGGTASVSFSLRRRDVSYWDVAAQNWAIASGEYTFAVGSSSRDIRSNATLTI